MRKPCLICGTPTDATRCPAHKRQRQTPEYSYAWKQQARTLYGLPCVYCGRPADTADHVIPRSCGGTDDPSNIVPACRSCNSAKRDR